MLSEMKSPYLLLFCLFSLSLLAQSPVDSLENYLKDKDDSTRSSSYINLSKSLMFEDRQLSLEMAKRGEIYGKKAGKPALEGTGQLFQAIQIEDLVSIDSSLKVFEKSFQTLDAIDHPYAFYPVQNMVRLYSQKGYYASAMEFQIKSIRIAEKHNDSISLKEAYSALGYLYDRIGDYREALRWYNKSLTEFDWNNSEKNYGVLQGRIGIAYDELGMPDSAHYWNNHALELFIQLEDWYDASIWCSNIGNTYIKQKDWQKAEESLNRSLAFYEKTKRMESAGLTYVNLAKVYLETGRIAQAESLLNKSIFEKQGYTEPVKLVAEANFRLSELEEKKGNYKAALEHFKTYEALQDSMLSMDRLHQLEDLRIRYETEKKERVIYQLNAEQERQKLELATKQINLNRNRLLISGISTLSLLVMLLGGIWFFQRQKKLEHQLSTERFNYQKELLRSSIIAQEEERKRIASELHDGIGQQLTALKMTWQSLQRQLREGRSPDGENMERISEIVNETSRDVRELSHRMMPRTLSEMGLIPAIEDMLNKTLGHSAIKFTFEHYRIQGRMEERIEVSLYRILQELVNNVVKHSQASEMSVQLMRSQNHIVLIVEDNGKGFNFTQKEKSGIGLMNVTSRVNSVNGEISYQPSPGSGTLATVRIPV